MKMIFKPSYLSSSSAYGHPIPLRISYPAMQQPPNCTPGTGCKVIDVLIVGPNGVVAQWTVGQ